MKFIYRYIQDELIPGKFSYVPLIVANLGEYKIPIMCLIDTGSPVTIIHSPLAVSAGVIPSSGRKSVLRGVGGDTISGFYHDIELVVCGYRYSCQAFVTADMQTPYCLLGQVGFFQHFRVTFDLPKLSFEVIPVSL